MSDKTNVTQPQSHPRFQPKYTQHLQESGRCRQILSAQRYARQTGRPKFDSGPLQNKNKRGPPLIYYWNLFYPSWWARLFHPSWKWPPVYSGNNLSPGLTFLLNSCWMNWVYFSSSNTDGFSLIKVRGHYETPKHTQMCWVMFNLYLTLI